MKVEYKLENVSKDLRADFEKEQTGLLGKLKSGIADKFNLEKEALLAQLKESTLSVETLQQANSDLEKSNAS